MVNGRDRSKLLDSVTRQAAAVRVALSTFQDTGVTGADIPVVSVLCFDGADLPMFGTPRIGGVPLLGAKGTAKLLRAATGSLDEARWPLSIDTSLKQCRRPEETISVLRASPECRRVGQR